MGGHPVFVLFHLPWCLRTIEAQARPEAIAVGVEKKTREMRCAGIVSFPVRKLENYKCLLS